MSDPYPLAAFSTPPTARPAVLFRLAGASLVSSVGLGVSVGSLGLSLGRWRWLHHALFAASVVANTVAMASDRTRRPRRAAVSASVLAILALLPFTAGGSRRHRAVGLAALGTHTVGGRLA